MRFVRGQLDAGRSPRGRLWRSRWAAIGAAVTVAVGGGGVVHLATASSSAPSSFVSITPVRILDTRDGVGVGLTGPFVSADGRDLQVTGSVPTTSGTQDVVPAGATAVALNVTVVEPTAAGFLSVRPAGTAGPPETSNLNFGAGDIVPNAVTVALPTAGAEAGAIELTYDAFGVVGPETDVLADVVGYFVEGTGVPGPAGPEGPTGPQGEPGAPAPTELLPVAFGNINSNGAVLSGYNVSGGSYNVALGQFAISFDGFAYGPGHVTVVTPSVSGCDAEATWATSHGSGNLHVHFRTSDTQAEVACPFSFVTYLPG